MKAPDSRIVGALSEVSIHRPCHLRNNVMVAFIFSAGTQRCLFTKLVMVESHLNFIFNDTTPSSIKQFIILLFLTRLPLLL